MQQKEPVKYSATLTSQSTHYCLTLFLLLQDPEWCLRCLGSKNASRCQCQELIQLDNHATDKNWNFLRFSWQPKFTSCLWEIRYHHTQKVSTNRSCSWDANPKLTDGLYRQIPFQEENYLTCLHLTWKKGSLKVLPVISAQKYSVATNKQWEGEEIIWWLTLVIRLQVILGKYNRYVRISTLHPTGERTITSVSRTNKQGLISKHLVPWPSGNAHSIPFADCGKFQRRLTQVSNQHSHLWQSKEKTGFLIPPIARVTLPPAIMQSLLTVYNHF